MERDSAGAMGVAQLSQDWGKRATGNRRLSHACAVTQYRKHLTTHVVQRPSARGTGDAT